MVPKTCSDGILQSRLMPPLQGLYNKIVLVLSVFVLFLLLINVAMITLFTQPFLPKGQ